MQGMTTYLTPPQLAKLWKCKPDKIVCLIKRGELEGFDISHNPGIGRPRYRISWEAIKAFEQRRSGAAPAKSLRKRKAAMPKDFVRYFS